MIELTMRPAGRGLFEVFSAGEWILTSRQPLLDAARWLRDHGVNPYEEMTIRAEGCAYPSFKPAPIYKLAGLAVYERDGDGLLLGVWKPFDRPDGPTPKHQGARLDEKPKAAP